MEFQKKLKERMLNRKEPKVQTGEREGMRDGGCGVEAASGGEMEMRGG